MSYLRSSTSSTFPLATIAVTPVEDCLPPTTRFSWSEPGMRNEKLVTGFMLPLTFNRLVLHWNSSILSGSTSYRLEIAKLSLTHFPDELRVSPKGTNERALDKRPMQEKIG